jgi:two-component system sensor kinase FixL
VITPLTLRLALHPQPLLNHIALRTFPELILFIGVVIAALWVIVAAGPNGAKLFYLMFLPVVVAAVRYGLDGACVGLGITQLALVGLLHRHGYEASAFAEFQLLMLVLSATGLTVGVVVTERKHADETVREMERQLKAKEVEAAQAARFNLVSGTAAALGHEINQPMTAARALARSVQELLRGPVPNLARIEANIGNLIIQIDHAGGVVRRMREFLRRGRPHSSTVAIRELLTNALALARPEAASKDISITLDAPDDLPVVHGDVVQLQQVVLNLVRNAEEAVADARTPNGHITVVARRLEAPARIEISIVDNGPGITAEVVERLFHPLTTSKTDGLGLGFVDLGFDCRGARRAHLAADGQGRGDRISIFTAARNGLRCALSGPTVFVIDDQKAVRDALREMLSVFGFSVETYESADSFLAALSDPEIGCIVADVRMPGTDGIELVRELARRKARLPVVLNAPWLMGKDQIAVIWTF